MYTEEVAPLQQDKDKRQLLDREYRMVICFDEVTKKGVLRRARLFYV